jgi:hypothetical protein
MMPDHKACLPNQETLLPIAPNYPLSIAEQITVSWKDLLGKVFPGIFIANNMPAQCPNKGRLMHCPFVLLQAWSNKKAVNFFSIIGLLFFSFPGYHPIIHGAPLYPLYTPTSCIMQ